MTGRDATLRETPRGAHRPVRSALPPPLQNLGRVLQWPPRRGRFRDLHRADRLERDRMHILTPRDDAAAQSRLGSCKRDVQPPPTRPSGRYKTSRGVPMSERRGGSRWRDLPYRVPLFTERETLRCPPQSFSGHSCPDGPDAPDGRRAARSVRLSSRANSGAPNSACTQPPSLSPLRVVLPPCHALRAGLCHALSSLPIGCAPKGCVCAHTFDIAMREEREMRLQGEGGAGVCVRVW